MLILADVNFCHSAIAVGESLEPILDHLLQGSFKLIPYYSSVECILNDISVVNTLGYKDKRHTLRYQLFKQNLIIIWKQNREGTARFVVLNIIILY